jgi:hypothetical protein
MSEIEKFKTMVKNHDLTFSYSDDGEVYRRGSESLSKIKKIAETLPREEVVRVWNEIVDGKLAVGFRETFYWKV